MRSLLHLKKQLTTMLFEPAKPSDGPSPTHHTHLLNSKTELLLQMSSSSGGSLFDAGTDVENFCPPRLALLLLSSPAASPSPTEPAGEAPASSRGLRRPPSPVERGLEGVGPARGTPNPSRRGCCGAGVPAGGASRKAHVRVATQSRADDAVDEESFQCRLGGWHRLLRTLELLLELASISTRFRKARHTHGQPRQSKKKSAPRNHKHNTQWGTGMDKPTHHDLRSAFFLLCGAIFPLQYKVLFERTADPSASAVL